MLRLYVLPLAFKLVYYIGKNVVDETSNIHHNEIMHVQLYYLY